MVVKENNLVVSAVFCGHVLCALISEDNESCSYCIHLPCCGKLTMSDFKLFGLFA